MLRADAWVPAWVALGSNQDDPEAQIQAALLALDALPATRVQRHSASYRSAPMGPVVQADFINAVAGLLTQLAPGELLAHLQRIEVAAGRRREKTIRWGPRALDLDILTYEMQEIHEPGLRIPHPGIPDRNFVLLPLLELAPCLFIPGLGRVQQLAAGIDAAGLECLG